VWQNGRVYLYDAGETPYQMDLYKSGTGFYVILYMMMEML